jgi:mandelate racemase
MQTAGIAAARGIRMSSHLLPEVSSHLLNATPTAHWLEYVDWADAVLRGPLTVTNGTVVAADRPGTGIEWDEDKIQSLDEL